jgi:hypothetical protein
VVERSAEFLNHLREQIKALSKQSHYEAYKESFQAYDSEEIPQDVVEDFKQKFTVRSFKEDIATVFPVLYRLMKEGNTIGYDDIVAMTQEEINNEDLTVETEDNDPFAQFENWVMGLGEDSAVTSEDPEEQQAALQGLQELVGQHFPAGVDGTNAIESLKGLIEDPELYKRIKEQAAEDPDACVRPLISDWLEFNAPEALEQLDFGDMVDDPEAAQGGDQTAPEAEPAPVDPAAAAVPAEEPVPQEAVDPDNPRDYERPAVDRKKAGQSPLSMKDVEYKDDKPKRDFEKRKERLNTEELAEFLHSFYDRDSGTFPKGPEGVCTMVGKKFGEQAEHVARKMVERMAPQQQDPQIAELSRMRELAGY